MVIQHIKAQNSREYEIKFIESYLTDAIVIEYDTDLNIQTMYNVEKENNKACLKLKKHIK